KGISWKALKSADRLRASALAEAAGALDLEVHLALADIRETWDCEMDEPSWGYGSRRRYWDDYDDDEEMEEDGDDEGSAELLDLIDDSTTIKHWRDAQGQIVSLPEWYVSGSEICWTKANGELDPSQSEYEGWMGNYGNTMERWYHRAAIILWRRDERYAALLEIAPEVMIRELLRLAEKKTMRAQSQEIVRCLLPNWSGLRGSDTKPSSFNRIFRLALRLDASEPAQGLLLPLGIDALCPETAQAMNRLQTAYGAQWLIEVLRTWLDSSTYPVWGSIIDRLSPIIKRWVEHAPGDHGELTHWLLGRQLGALKRKQLHQVQADAPVTYAKNAPGRIAKITDLLSASLLSLDSAIFAEMIDHLIADDSGYPVFDLVEISRYVKRQNRQVGGVGGHCARLLEFVRGKLTTALDSP
ncbi:MAG: hypothetical protein GY731_19565, partial [Gammaproteobacteria bacterium]|nr:hypothetical protein [Gammaproteobacteria bacterium]